MTGRWGALVVVLAAVAALSLGSAAGSCRFAFDCHLRPAPSYRESAAATLARIRKEPATGAVQAAPGLRDEVVTAGFELPTDFTFLPGGDVLVAEMGGRVVRLRDGGRRRTVLLDLRDRVSTTYFRGLTAIAVDPHYRRNHHLYVVYAVRREETEGRDAPTTVRVSRFTAGEGEGSEQVLLGTVAGGSCDDREAVADCIPANVDHIGAGLAFARDGSLFVSTGDGGRVQDDVELASLRAQDPDSLGGKVLRITRDGQGIRDNPFWTGDPSANASKVWAVGLRNPFRMSLSTGRPPLLGDVGEARFEEIDAATRGANLGWPCYEGRIRNALYAAAPVCTRLYARGAAAVVPPIVALSHRESGSITGGPLEAAGRRPQRSRYFYADWARGWLRVAILDDRHRLVGRPRQLATGLAGPSSLRLRPDGWLYYLAFGSGELRRIGRDGCADRGEGSSRDCFRASPPR